VVAVGGDVYHLNVNDFGPESVDGWLAGLVAAELGVDAPELLDRLARELVLGKERVPLTRLEFGVLEYLMDREGQAVSRASLIQDVWGHSYTGGSNVIEAVVRSLRKKLRDRASCVETVSGVGYRFRSG
jgi:DNA-binding response OmpR family regulator